MLGKVGAFLVKNAITSRVCILQRGTRDSLVGTPPLERKACMLAPDCGRYHRKVSDTSSP